MADVRSMLKASREARRVHHPYASYTSDGKLLCNLCETTIKTESAWQSHLHSTQHTARQTRAKEATQTRGANGVASNKKRKADASPEDAKKKLKATVVPPSGTVNEDEEEQGPVEQNGQEMTSRPRKQDDEKGADPEELAAFEQQLLEMEKSMKREQANVTISAPPMTAEEIAAQAREEQSTQREKRAAELEAEKEDAARVLEDELEEMEGLEARAKKLRERREMLRKGKESGTTTDAAVEPEAETNGKVEDGGGGPAEEDEEDDDDDDDEDFDEWNFGAQ